jgi:hypothetical protein
MDGVTVIRVDPDKLRSSANVQRSLQEEVAALAARLGELGAAAPSYDGQFGPPVQGITAEGIGRLQALGVCLGERAEFLEHRAQLFEAADQELGERLAWIESLVREWVQGSQEILDRRRILDWLSGRLTLTALASLYPGGELSREVDDDWLKSWLLFFVLLARQAAGATFLEVPQGELSDAQQALLGRMLPWLEAYLDERYFGERIPMEPPEGVEGMLWLSGMSREDLLSVHQWQLDPTMTTPNDCAVTAMAMAINMAREQMGITGEPVQHGALAELLDQAGLRSELGQRVGIFADGFELGDILGLITGAGEGSGLDLPFRIPAGFPLGEGAMPPPGMEAALNWYAEEHLPEGSGSWTVTTSSGNDVNDLIHNLQEGNPTVIYGVGGDIPHTVVVAGYDSSNDLWQILDPGRLPTEQPRAWTTAELEAWWGGKYFAYPRYTMVVLEVEAANPIQPVPERPPTPPATTDIPSTPTPAPIPLETPTPGGMESP